ncbi:MAG: hypothetical protein QOJ82_1174 [Solirubrobacteraceae bacterium]|nr:hypothetical protein [Solirubrobacteraceae bacterium]
MRGQVAADLEALNAFTAKFRREDAKHQEALRQAYRDGNGTPKDRRVPTDEREAQRAAVLERVFAGAHVLADHADHVIPVSPAAPPTPSASRAHPDHHQEPRAMVDVDAHAAVHAYLERHRLIWR